MAKFIEDLSRRHKGTEDTEGTFLQSSMWGEFKERFGWEAKAFTIEWVGEKSSLLVLCRRLAPGFSFAYVPWGPQLPASFSAEDRANALAELANKLKKNLSRNTAFIRFDLPQVFNEGDENPQKEASLLQTAGLKKSAVTVQAPDTVIINLENSCEELLAQMKPKWRYNINLAHKKGVKVKTSSHDNNPIAALEIFYLLMKETAERDGILIHDFKYYKTLFDLASDSKDTAIRLYIAEHEGENLAAIMVLFRGKEAVYLYGASSNNKRNLMAPYALQWKAIQDAKEHGCQFYDLFGIPPNEDPNHPMAGLYRFKTGFGGQIIHRPGCWDYAYKPFFYNLFKLAETLRKKIMNKRKRR